MANDLMYDELIREADAAEQRLAHLASWDEASHADLVDAMAVLRAAIDEAGSEPGAQLRGRVAVLTGYVQTTAYYLHEHMIPLCEQQASQAALEIGHAATRMLIAFEHDYGEITVN